MSFHFVDGYNTLPEVFFLLSVARMFLIEIIARYVPKKQHYHYKFVFLNRKDRSGGAINMYNNLKTALYKLKMPNEEHFQAKKPGKIPRLLKYYCLLKKTDYVSVFG